MRRPAAHNCRLGFTLLELLVVIGIVVILISILLPVFSQVMASQRRVRCLSNLSRIDLALKQYSADNEVLPDPASTDTSWEQLLQPYLGATGFICPSDNEIAPAVGSSYDWRDTGDPNTTLAGRTLASARGSAVLAFDSLPGWHGSRKMNAVLVNGSAAEMDQDTCIADLGKLGRGN